MKTCTDRPEREKIPWCTSGKKVKYSQKCKLLAKQLLVACFMMDGSRDSPYMTFFRDHHYFLRNKKYSKHQILAIKNRSHLWSSRIEQLYIHLSI